MAIYLDNAATSFPKPEPVYQACDRFFRKAAANPGRSGHEMAVEAESTVKRSRHRLAELLGVKTPERLVWTLNATHAINQALKGLLKPGDSVVTTQLEHNAVARPLKALEAQGVRVTRVPAPGGQFDLPLFLAALSPATRLVVMVHASNVTGEILPVEEVGAYCRARGIRLLVDAAQTAGTQPIDVAAMAIDLLAVPGHKSLLGPPGTGALYIAEGVELAPLWEGGTGSQSELDEQPDVLPDRFESGTVNTVGIAGLGASVQWIRETGVESIRKREEALMGQLLAELKAIPGVTVFGPGRDARRAPVVSFVVDGWEPTDAAITLEQAFGIQCRPGLHCAPWAHRSLGTFPSGTVRFSPGYFNTEVEIEAAGRAVAALAKNAG